MDEVGDVVMGLADGVWGLVKGGIAGLLRVGVHSKGAYLRVGYAIISGESTWCIKTALATYQTQATQFGKSITHWTLDAGTGMVSGVKGVTKQEEEHEDNRKDVDAKGDSKDVDASGG